MPNMPVGMRNKNLQARRESFKALKKKGRKLILAEGDSWFDYPLHSDVIDHLGKTFGFGVYSLSHRGDELEKMFKTSQWYQYLYKEEWTCFLFSGGGNDILHSCLPELLIDRNTVTKREDIIIKQNLDFELHRMSSLYQRIYDATQAIKPELPMVVHGYDYALPSGRPTKFLLWTFGPWLKPELDKKNITDKEEQEFVVHFLIESFNQELEVLDNKNTHFHYVNCRNVVNGRWKDEIHPTSAGFKDVAQKIKEQIDVL